MRRLSSFGRSQRRKAERNTAGVSSEALRAYVSGERIAQRLFTKDDVLDFVAQLRASGKAFELPDVIELLNANTRQAIQICYTVLMENHIAGAAKILRDVDPYIVEIYKELERLTVEDGQEVASDKMRERYELAKKRTYRKLKSSNPGDLR